MPAKPIWYTSLAETVAALQSADVAMVDSRMLASLLRIGLRRAQQILAPVVTERLGLNGLAPKEAVLERLRQMAAGEDALYEQRRRARLAGKLEKFCRDRRTQPVLLVEAPTSITGQTIDGLPPAIRIQPGKLEVEFISVSEALEHLLSLAMAIGNDPDRFERLAAPDRFGKPTRQI